MYSCLLNLAEADEKMTRQFNLQGLWAFEIEAETVIGMKSFLSHSLKIDHTFRHNMTHFPQN